MDVEAIPKRWPLVTPPLNRSGQVNTDGRLVNCYVELDPSDGQYWIQKRPGLVTTIPFGVGTGNGCYYWSQVDWSVFSGQLYKAGAAFRAVDSTSFYKWTDIQDTTPLLFLKNEAAAYYTDGTVSSQVTDPDYPNPTVPGVAFIDGYTCVMTPSGRIYNSDLNLPGSWGALNFLVAQTVPGLGKAIFKHLSYVVALKEFSTEFFYNAGNPSGSPLARLQGGIIPFGCVDGYSVAEIDGMQFWVSTNHSSSRQVVKLENMNISVVSTPPITRILESVTTFTSRAFGIKIAGHRFYCIGFSNTGVTLVYDIDQNIWYEWTATDGANRWPIVDSCNNVSGQILVQGQNTGAMYPLQPDYTTPADLGVMFPVDIYTQNWDMRVGRNKTLFKFRFVSDQQSAGILKVRCSDDDYKTWTNFRSVDLGSKNPMLTNCGTFYRRAYHLRMFSRTPMRIKCGDLNFKLGTA